MINVSEKINALKSAQGKCSEAKSEIAWATEEIAKTLRRLEKSVSQKAKEQMQYHIARILREEELRFEHDLAEAYRKITEDR